MKTPRTASTRQAALRRLPVLLLIPLMTLAGGCHYMAAGAIFWADEPTKKVPAEYPWLVDQEVCIVVRASMETLFDHPHVQYELADHVRGEDQNLAKIIA